MLLSRDVHRRDSLAAKFYPDRCREIFTLTAVFEVLPVRSTKYHAALPRQSGRLIYML